MTENNITPQVTCQDCLKFGIVCIACRQLSHDNFDKVYHESRRAGEIEYLLNHKITKLEQALGWKEIDRKGTKNYEIMKYSQAFMEELVTMMKEENKRLEQALAVAQEALEKIKAIKEEK